MNPLHNYAQWKAGGYSATVDEWEDWAERIVAAFRAELKAAENDHERYKELEAENATLGKAYADECSTNVYLKAEKGSRAMNTWTDDKEQELFEAQETIAELLEALEGLLGYNFIGEDIMEHEPYWAEEERVAFEAIRKASQ